MVSSEQVFPQFFFPSLRGTCPAHCILQNINLLIFALKREEITGDWRKCYSVVIVIFPMACIINITDHDDKSNEAMVEKRSETDGIDERIWVEVENVRETAWKT